MNQKGRPNSDQLKQLKSQSVCANIDFDTRIIVINLGFLLRNRLGMSQYLNVLLSSSGNNLTGLCVAKYFRKLLGAHVSKCRFDYTI